MLWFHREKLASLAHIVAHLSDKFPGVEICVREDGFKGFRVSVESSDRSARKGAERWLADYGNANGHPIHS